MNAQADAKLDYIIKGAFTALSGQIIIDEEGRILFFSDEHVKYTGIPRSEAIGQPVEKILPSTRLHIVARTGIAEIGSIIHFEHRETKKVTSVVCNRIPIIENGKIIGVMAETTFSRGVEEIFSLMKEIERLKARNEYYESQLSFIGVNQDPCNICGHSEKIEEAKNLLYKIADLTAPVLILGETGTGKEVFANILHSCSKRKTEKFVKINCSAIPAELLESELFGYEEGAFSGARKGGKIGKFEYARNGTILLDEIGDMPLKLQAKLLRVIQEKEFERVGGLKPQPFNARIVCTTHQNLEALIREKKFREDLYYRINVFELTLPPLRERTEDIRELCKFFIDKINREEGLSIVGICDDVLALFHQYDWPGNVRELKHIVERACFLVGGGTLNVSHFDFFLERMKKNGLGGEAETVSKSSKQSLGQKKAAAEKEAIAEALRQAAGNKSAAAKILGIDRSVLYDKIKKYDM